MVSVFVSAGFFSTGFFSTGFSTTGGGTPSSVARSGLTSPLSTVNAIAPVSASPPTADPISTPGPLLPARAW